MRSQRDAVLNTREVAALYGVNTKTVKRWASAGLLPHFKTPGGHYRMLRSEVESPLRGEQR